MNTQNQIVPMRFSTAIISANNNTELGIARRNCCFDLIYRWGYTTAAILADTLKIAPSAVYRSLRSWKSQGLIKGVHTLCPISREILMLTRNGLAILQNALARAGNDVLLEGYQFDPSRINFHHMTHTLACQIATLYLLNEKGFTSFATENELVTRSQKGIKQPDVIVANSEGLTVAVEVELSPKNARNLDQAMLANLHLLRKDKADAIWYVSHLPAILRGIERSVGRHSIPLWEKNHHGKWNITGRKELTQKEHSRFRFRLLNQLSRLYP